MSAPLRLRSPGVTRRKTEANPNVGCPAGPAGRKAYTIGPTKAATTTDRMTAQTKTASV